MVQLKNILSYTLTFLLCGCVIPPYKFEGSPTTPQATFQANNWLSIANSNKCSDARYVQKEEAAKSIKIVADKRTWVIVHFIHYRKIRFSFLPKQGKNYFMEELCEPSHCRIELYRQDENGKKIPEPMEPATTDGFC